MNARKQRQRRARQEEPAAPAAAPLFQGHLPRLMCLAAFAALVVATPLLPGEAAADEGVYNPLAVGWLAVAGLALAVVAIQPQTSLRWNTSLLLVMLFSAWMAVPTLLQWRHLHPRPAINVTFVYLAAGACVFTTVQLLHDRALRQKLIALLLVVAAGLAAFGLYQYAVTIPETARQYFEASESQKQRILQQYNFDPSKDSADRRHFEDRLRSTEPFATFGLANSLAGFLAPALVLALGAWLVEFQGQRRVSTLFAFTFIIALCGVCLILTKSRTAYLAAFVGAAFFATVYYGRRVSLKRWLLAIGGGSAAIVSVVFVAAMTGGLDLKVVSESIKSFRYRLEYWQATAAMIVDMPLLGCGPGQFQSVYPRYKLPQASETVADPHNMFLEVWSTAGLPALMLLLAAIVTAILLWRSSTSDSNPTEPHDGPDDSQVADRAPRDEPSRSPFGSDSPNSDAELGASIALNIGAGAGVAVALAAGAMTDSIPSGIVFLTLLISFAVVFPLTWRSWELPGCALVAALVAWGVHHLAAGGFSYPGVAIVGWILSAVILADLRLKVWSPPTWARLTLLSAAGGLVLLGMQVATRPLEARQALNSVLMRNSIQDARRLALEAAALDPFWVEPRVRLAGIEHQLWLSVGSDAGRRGYLDAEAQMLQLDPQTWLRSRQAGNWRLMAWRATGGAEQLQASIEFYEQALERYPNSLGLLAQLAWTYHLAGREDDAARMAEEAMRFNDRHPHEEQKLEYMRIYDFPSGPNVDGLPAAPGRESAEQVMRRLRKSTGE